MKNQNTKLNLSIVNIKRYEKKEKLNIRIPKKDEDLVGKICVCSIGRVAIVTGEKEFEWGYSWVGIGFDGKGTWASSAPCIIAESGEEFHDKLFDRFGGKMSFNG